MFSLPFVFTVCCTVFHASQVSNYVLSEVLSHRQQGSRPPSDSTASHQYWHALTVGQAVVGEWDDKMQYVTGHASARLFFYASNCLTAQAIVSLALKRVGSSCMQWCAHACVKNVMPPARLITSFTVALLVCRAVPWCFWGQVAGTAGVLNMQLWTSYSQLCI